MACTLVTTFETLKRQSRLVGSRRDWTVTIQQERRKERGAKRGKEESPPSEQEERKRSPSPCSSKCVAGWFPQGTGTQVLFSLYYILALACDSCSCLPCEGVKNGTNSEPKKNAKHLLRTNNEQRTELNTLDIKKTFML